ncbi:MAG: hypothetical protein M3O36_12220 [Myxococcota bacterium]|nr:hypothetical protein [Myxococcota bacterium]
MVLHVLWPQTVHRGAQRASCGQFVFEAHCGAQYPAPFASAMQCFSAPLAGNVDWQS